MAKQSNHCIDVWCSFETCKPLDTGADQRWLDWLEKEHEWLSLPAFFFQTFFPSSALQKTATGGEKKRVLNSSCSGVVFLLRMINEGSLPTKTRSVLPHQTSNADYAAEVFSDYQLTSYSPIFFLIFPRVSYVCVYVYVWCQHWCDELCGRGGFFISLLSSPPVH